MFSFPMGNMIRSHRLRWVAALFSQFKLIVIFYWDFLEDSSTVAVDGDPDTLIKALPIFRLNKPLILCNNIWKELSKECIWRSSILTLSLSSIVYPFGPTAFCAY